MTRAMESVRKILLLHILMLQEVSSTSHAAIGMMSVEMGGMSLTVSLTATNVAIVTVCTMHHMIAPKGVRLILILVLTDIPALCVARLVTLQETVLTKVFSKEQALLHLLLNGLLHLLMHLPVLVQIGPDHGGNWSFQQNAEVAVYCNVSGHMYCLSHILLVTHTVCHTYCLSPKLLVTPTDKL